MTQEDLLRASLGEDVPLGGVDTDTLFTDQEIADLVQVHGSAASALAQGWEIKAARLSDMVNITEGSTNRSLSQAFDHALRMANEYSSGQLGTRKPAAVLHRIEREYGTF